jgi:hypothetical protein
MQYVSGYAVSFYLEGIPRYLITVELPAFVIEVCRGFLSMSTRMPKYPLDTSTGTSYQIAD